MRRLRGAAVWLVLLWSTGALAHAHLTDSSPVDGSQLLEGPAALVLTFSEAVQLTALSIQRSGATPQKLVPPEQVASRISVALPKLARRSVCRTLAHTRQRWARGARTDPLHHQMIDGVWLALRAAAFILVLQAAGYALFLAAVHAYAGTTVAQADAVRGSAPRAGGACHRPRAGTP